MYVNSGKLASWSPLVDLVVHFLMCVRTYEYVYTVRVLLPKGRKYHLAKIFPVAYDLIITGRHGRR